MIVRRFAGIAIALGAAGAIGACTQLGTLSPPNPNVSSPRIFNYTAIAASDGVGVGASHPCPTATVGPFNEIMPSPASCPGGSGYVPVLSGLLSTGANVVTLSDLGISGAVLGPTERTLADTWEPFVFGCAPSGPGECAPGDFITDELPLIPSQQNTVTIFAGGNDTNAIFAHAAVLCSSGCTPGQVQAIIGPDIANFLLDYQTLLVAIHNSFPFARIYAANLPNFGLIPRGKGLGGQAQALLDVVSTNIDYNNPTGMNPHGINVDLPAHGVPVVDLECDPQSYNPANFSPDGFHPDDAGYLLFASKFAPVIKNYGGPLPQTTCPPYSQFIVHQSLQHIGHVKYIRY